MGFGAADAVGPGGGELGFGAAKESRADHDSAGAEDESCGDAARIGDAAGGDDRDGDSVDDLRDKGDEADGAVLGLFEVESAAMTASFCALRDDGVRACGFGGAGFVDGGGGGEPEDVEGLHFSDERGAVEAHDGGDGARARGEQGAALRVEVGKDRFAVFGDDGRSPVGEEVALALLGVGIARGDWAGDPEVELKFTGAVLAEFFDPGADGIRVHQEGTTGAHAAGVGDGDGERGGTGSSHGREEDGELDAEAFGEGLSAGERGRGEGHWKLLGCRAKLPF